MQQVSSKLLHFFLFHNFVGEFGAVKFKMPKDGVLKMSYIEQARKREKCYRLSCFIHLVDYIQTNMMHGLLLNAYTEFMEVLKIHTESLPDDDLINNDKIDLILEENRPASHCIQVNLIMIHINPFCSDIVIFCGDCHGSS